MAGGGSNNPRPVAPTVNTSNVQHSTGAPSTNPTTGGTTGGKGGGGQPQITPHMNPNSVSFSGYGQSQPFGFGQGPATNIWGTGGATSQPQQWNRQNTFNPNQFAQSNQSLGGSSSSSAPLATSQPNAPGSALSQSEMDDLQARAAAGDQQAADTIQNNQLNVTGQGAQAGGFMSGITGTGDDWGSSLATGQQSNVGLQDRAIALGETVGGFSPIIGGVTNAVADRVAPRNQFQADNRTAQEVSIDRQTKRWQDSNNDNDAPHMTHQEILDAHALQRNQDLGYSSTPSQSAAAAGFDMNDSSTWLQPEDRVDLTSTGTSQSSSSNDNDDSGGGSGGGK